METMRYKIRLIFVPFLWVAAGFILVYTFLNWWLVIYLGLVSWKEGVINFLLPFFLPWIPVLIWIRPKIRLTAVGPNQQVGLLFAFVLSVAVPTMFLQNYLEIASGKLTSLQTIHQIKENKPVKYYTVQNYYAAKEFAKTDTPFITSTRSNTLTYHIYISTPLLDKPLAASEVPATRVESDSLMAASPPLAFWLCVHYEKTIDNHFHQWAKDEIWRSFWETSWQDFTKKDFNQAVYLERMENSDATENYKVAVKRSPYYSSSPGSLVLLEPRYEPFAQHSGQLLGWVLGSCCIGMALPFLVALLIPLKDPDAGIVEAMNAMR